MSDEKKRKARRIPFGDELELYIRDAEPQELIDLQVRIAKEVRIREMLAKRMADKAAE